MIAYNEQSLDQLAITNEAALARKKHLITEQEFTSVLIAHKPILYKPNVFIRIGLFVLTVVIAATTFGLMMFILRDTIDDDPTLFILTLIFGCFIYAALEWIVQRKKHYRSGVDDAHLWLAFISITVDIGIYYDLSSLLTSLMVFVLSVAAAIRFANAVMSAVALCSFICIIIYGLSSTSVHSNAAIPYVVLLFSLFIYFLIKKIKHHQLLRHYRFCFITLEVLSLIIMYASVNYYVIRKGSTFMFDLYLLNDKNEVPAAWFYWLCTFLVPIIYIVRGIRIREHLILRVGLLTAAAGILTVRYYYSLVPVEQIMTAGGVLLIVLSYAFIRYLRSPKHGITDYPQEQSTDRVQGESLIVAETFKESPAADQGFQFGGGSTGGGGASGEF